MKEKRTPAVLTGQAIGDALGMPFERPREDVHPNLATWKGDYLPGTHHKLPAGHWTDDTEMAIELATSLLETRGEYNPALTATKYLAWANGTPHGMGGTTRKAMDNLRNGVPWQFSGVIFGDNDGPRVGNGTAMRIAPMGLVYLLETDWKKFEDAVAADVRITHNHVDAEVGAVVIATVVSHCVSHRLSGKEIMEMAIETAELFPESLVTDKLVTAIRAAGAKKSPEEVIQDLGRGGNVSSTVASAVFCAGYHADSFKQGVVASVRCGGDTDTRGAITGAILGANLGYEGIPPEYLSGLLQADRLRTLDQQLFALRPARELDDDASGTDDLQA